jgi:single-stranded-DNA-specific exonuclease
VQVLAYQQPSEELMEVLYGGKTSLLGKQWHLKGGDDRIALSISQRHSCPEIVGRILSTRGVTSETAAQFLDPKLRDHLPDPFHLKDMEKAIDRVCQAILLNQKIMVFADYDVDGATSSALLKRYFQAIGLDLGVYIPDRIEEGYGPNIPAMRHLAQGGTKVLIMVDCGTTAFEPLQEAKNLGMDVIVVDHHTAQPELPSAYALINPNRLDESSSFTTLCAAGLTFLFIIALNKTLRQRGVFCRERAEPDLRQYLDLVALGTVCDVMPLTHLNRAYVLQGLKVLKHRQNPGLVALSDVAGMNESPSAYHLGFLLGPRVNAGGRVGKADYGSRLLATQDPTEARLLAGYLDTYNKERQTIESIVLEKAIEQVERFNLSSNPVILVADDNWHPGVIGIVASRLKEKYGKPSCVVGYSGDVGKGSGRSIAGVHLGQAMHRACDQGLLVYGGGHAMAAGFTVMREQFQVFSAFLQTTLASCVQSIKPRSEVDGFLSLRGLTLELMDHLSLLEPFGNGNPTPKFVLQHVIISYAERVGTDHIRCFLVGEDGAKVKAMAFRCLDSKMGEFLLKNRSTPVHVLVTLKNDTWGGTRKVLAILEDIMLP